MPWTRVRKPGGVFVQWFHTYEISDDLVAVILRTLRQVELTVLDTYIGSTTAKRILAGRIRRGFLAHPEAILRFLAKPVAAEA